MKGRSTTRTMEKDAEFGIAVSRKSGRMEEAKSMLVCFMVLSSTKNTLLGSRVILHN